MSIKALVIIPTYNEVENVADIITEVLGQGDNYHVLIVDDGSPDGTVDVVNKFLAKYPERVFIHQRLSKQGLGSAYLAGFAIGLKKGYDYIFEMDADFSHNPDDLPRLLSACTDQGADVAIGSRYTKGGGLKDWPMDRLLLSKAASLYVRTITWMPIMDSTAGFKCYSAKVLSSLDLSKIKCKGYAFQIEMKYASYLNGFKLVEVPIIFKDREKGQSKMNGKIIAEALRGVLQMKRKAMNGYYKV